MERLTYDWKFCKSDIFSTSSTEVVKGFLLENIKDGRFRCFLVQVIITV